ncbi:hypothetical protein VTL71DRAFT_10299 [Oculimacula yallundae]|uniref:FAD-binding domain-containing protein n=1 Tax=Oculimacula yallundae TaxID=86028 RepID=A0ABR4CSN9_9HELO
MEIIIVGAGIGGLSASLALAHSPSSQPHKITIIESASVLAEIGAGIQLTPNATRCFFKWGLGPSLLAHSVLPATFNVRRDTSDELLSGVPLSTFEEQYSGPYLVVHRADLHRIMHEHAVEKGVKIRLGSRVTTYDFDGGEITLASGEVIKADLIVACDGIKSFARGKFLGTGAEEVPNQWIEPTGWAAYRLIAPVSKLAENPLTVELSTSHGANCWSGAMRSTMTYLVKDATALNIVLSHPDNVDTSSWTSEQYKAEIRKTFADVSPTVQALLEATNPEVQNWPVYQVKTLPKWVSETGKFVMMGDAAHGMAFYLSMGVSLAVEDGESLAVCIEKMESEGAGSESAGLKHAMHIFEYVRKRRAEAVRDASLHAGKMLHLVPGEARDIRDRAMSGDGRSGEDDKRERFFVEKTAYGLADGQIRDWCYGYDVRKEVEKEW